MHQRSIASPTRRWLTASLVVLMASGCLPTPTKPPTGFKSPAVQVAGKPAAPIASSVPSTTPSSQTLVPTLPIEVKAPIISHNGANAIQGTVRVPANIISHNGGNIISHNGGNIISHNGGNIIGNNGGNIIGNNGSSLKISQVPLAYATVRLKDAAGNPVKDDKGQELVAKTDENGNYKFDVEVTGRNLVVHAEVMGQEDDLIALLPKDIVGAGQAVDVDMASTLSLSYIMELYVKGNLATFEKLPKDLEMKARVQTEEAIVKGEVGLPQSLEREDLVKVVSETISRDQSVKSTFDEIKRLLVIVGIRNEGDGLPAIDIPIRSIDAAIADDNKHIYIFSRERHTLWKVDENGVASTIIPKGGWGYPETANTKIDYAKMSGMAFDTNGSLLVADSDHHRIVRISDNRQVSVVAGTGIKGFSGDGGSAASALIDQPTGLIVDNSGSVIFSDTGNHVIRRINSKGIIETIAGKNIAGYSPNGLTPKESSFASPQGLSSLYDGAILVADTGNNSVRLIKDNSVSTVGERGQFSVPLSIAAVNGESIVLCNGDSSLFKVSPSVSPIDSRTITYKNSSVYYFKQPKILVPFGNGFLIEDGEGRLFKSENTTSLEHVFGLIAVSNISSNLLNVATGLTASGDEIYISDMGRSQVLKVSPDGAFSVFAGSGASSGFIANSLNCLTSPIPFPIDVCTANDGSILVSSIGTIPVIRRIDMSGNLSTIAGNGKFDYLSIPIGPALEVSLASPNDLEQIADGTIVFAEPDQNRLMSLSPQGQISQIFEGQDLKYPIGLSKDSSGRLNYVELNGDRIVVLDKGERLTRLTFESLAPEIAVGEKIRGLAFDSLGATYVASSNKVVKVLASGEKVLIAGFGGKVLNGTTNDDGVFKIRALAVSESGDIFILEPSQLKKVERSILESNN